MQQALQVIAGTEARRRIAAEGFHLDHFDTFVGASGGPKWLTLYGIDKVLCGPLASRTRPMDLIGSSIGAMRMACYAQTDPGAAFDRFLESYVGITLQEFSKPLLAEFIRNTMRVAIEGNAADEILTNTTLRLHVVTARTSGLWLPRNAESLSLLAPAGLNAVHPALLRIAGVDRTVFASNLRSPLALYEPYVGERVQLTRANLGDALVASGSIPGLLDGVRNIAGARRGIHFDGGITDYHFNPSWNATDGLILYPHFGAKLVPGWFDKPFRSRHLDPSTIDRLVVLAPSTEFVASLPHGKIPDRRDVRWMAPPQMHAHWTTVVAESARLGDELATMLETGEVPGIG